MKKSAFLLAIILLSLVFGSAAAGSADVPVLPPLEEIVTGFYFERATVTAVGGASFLTAPEFESLPMGEDLDCSTRLYIYGVWIIPECSSN